MSKTTMKKKTGKVILTPNEQKSQLAAEKKQKMLKAKIAKRVAADRQRIRVTEEEPAAKRQTPVRRAVKPNPPVQTTRKPRIDNQPPPNVSNSPKLRKIWDTCSDDERRSAMLIYQLKSKMATSNIDSYFQFREDWDQFYPKQDRSNYKRGENTVKTGSMLAGESAVRVYQILSVTNIYSRAYYMELSAKATGNGVTLYWIHLRTLALRLGKSEYRSIRRKIEQEITKRQYTETQLNALIDELAPETAENRKAAVEKKREQAAESQESQESQQVGQGKNTLIATMVSGFSKIVPNYQSWVKAIAKWEAEYQTDSPEETEAAFNTVNTLMQQVRETRAFADQVEGILEQMQSTIGFYAKKTDEARQEEKRKQTERAETIRKRIDEDRVKHSTDKKEKEARLQLAAGFNDSDDDEEDNDDFDMTPRAQLRASDVYSEPDEGDEDEFGPVDGTENDPEDEDYDDEESQEWEDPEDEEFEDEEDDEVDEDDDIFDETGNLR